MTCTMCGRAACCRHHGHACEIECLTYAIAREKARADAAEQERDTWNEVAELHLQTIAECEAALARVLDVADAELCWASPRDLIDAIRTVAKPKADGEGRGNGGN